MRYVNLNPANNKKTGDCVVRAIAGASDKSWIEVFDGLVKIAREQYCMPSDPNVYEQYLFSIGFTKNTIPKTKYGEKRLNSKQLAAKTNAVIRQAHHLCFSKDGHVHDSWSSEDRTVYTYYTK